MGWGVLWCSLISLDCCLYYRVILNTDRYIHVLLSFGHVSWAIVGKQVFVTLQYGTVALNKFDWMVISRGKKQEG
mgnify:FL=1